MLTFADTTSLFAVWTNKLMYFHSTVILKVVMATSAPMFTKITYWWTVLPEVMNCELVYCKTITCLSIYFTNCSTCNSVRTRVTLPEMWLVLFMACDWKCKTGKIPAIKLATFMWIGVTQGPLIVDSIISRCILTGDLLQTTPYKKCLKQHWKQMRRGYTSDVVLSELDKNRMF